MCNKEKLDILNSMAVEDSLCEDGECKYVFVKEKPENIFLLHSIGISDEEIEGYSSDGIIDIAFFAFEYCGAVYWTAKAGFMLEIPPEGD